MSISTVRRYLALTLLTLFASVGAQAESEEFYGTTTINFDALGHSNYSISISASVAVGGDDYASAYAGFGGLFGSSFSSIGEAGVGIYLDNIHKVGSRWIADSVLIEEFDNYTGQYEYSYYYDYPLPTASMVYGSADCADQHETVAGSIIW